MQKDCILLSQNSLLLIQADGQWRLPKEGEIDRDQYVVQFDFQGLNSTEYLVGEVKFTTHENQKLLDFREAYHHIGKILFQLVGRARQLLDWRINHQFCGRCGSNTEFFDQNRAKKCVSCNLVNYPKISPCSLVAITRKDEILLAHAPQFRKNLYSVLAGFLEPGETIEGCIHREVMEEVGIKIKNLRYIASQSWPFPNLLMLGFTAEYESGEINIDANELTDAKWFHRNNMPSTLPLPITLSSLLIKNFLTTG